MAADKVKERWCLALEGVPSDDGRILVEDETTWRNPAAVTWGSEIVGKLIDWKRLSVDEGTEIHATYVGPQIPEGFVLSCSMIQIDVTQRDKLLWLKGIIAGASIMKGETMFGARTRRVNA